MATLVVAVPRLVRILWVSEIVDAVVLAAAEAAELVVAADDVAAAVAVVLVTVEVVFEVAEAVPLAAVDEAVVPTRALVAPVANPAAAAEMAIVCSDSLEVVSFHVVLPTSSRFPKRLPSVFTEAFTADVVAIVAAVPAPVLAAAAPQVANDPAPAVAIAPATAIVICPVLVRPAVFSFQLRLVSLTADRVN